MLVAHIVFKSAFKQGKIPQYAAGCHLQWKEHVKGTRSQYQIQKAIEKTKSDLSLYNNLVLYKQVLKRIKPMSSSLSERK